MTTVISCPVCDWQYLEPDIAISDYLNLDESYIREAIRERDRVTEESLSVHYAGHHAMDWLTALARRAAIIQAVRDLHAPVDDDLGDDPVCSVCLDDEQGFQAVRAAWPCPTIRVMRKAEGR